MENNNVCNICENPGTIDNALEVKLVRSNIRRFLHQEFTVWRCRNCRSLHCLQEIDYDEYYKDYVMENQKYDGIAKFILRRRLKLLTNAGLQKTDRILDYGCGTGFFVRYLKEKKYEKTFGYDPYSTTMAAVDVLKDPFDWVTAQDVIEHVPDPKEFIRNLKRYLKPRGYLAIGTPNAQELDLKSSVDVVGYLHQPYHRHLLAQNELSRLLEREGFEIVFQSKRFYLDSPIPFLNTNFLFRYADLAGGGFESCLEPLRWNLIFRNPKLFFYAFLGYFFLRHKSALVVCRLK